jgi:hypothetical protein
VHRTRPENREDGLRGPLRRAGGDYMLWWSIKIQEFE